MNTFVDTGLMTAPYITITTDNTSGLWINSGTASFTEDALGVVEQEIEPETEELEDNPDEMEVTPDVAMIFADFPEPEIEYDYLDNEDERYVYGEGKARHVRAIKFKKLAIAKAERNKNGDFLTRDNLEEIATSVEGMPITDRHPKRGGTPHIFGVMSRGYVATVTGGDMSGDYVFTDGTFWSGRHPSLVRQTIEGQRKPSIEAVGEQVGCSVCGSWHNDETTYCGHLKARMAGALGDNVSRLHKGLRAVGTALVPNPAGSNTGFHGGQFFLVAEEENYKETDMTEAEVKQLQDELAAAKAEKAALEASVSSYEQKVAEIEAAFKAAQDELGAKNAELEAAAGKYSTYTLRAPALIKANVDIDSLPITEWDEATYNAFLLRSQPPKPAKQATVVADSDTKPKSSWEQIFGGKA